MSYSQRRVERYHNSESRPPSEVEAELEPPVRRKIPTSGPRDQRATAALNINPARKSLACGGP